MDQDMWQQVSNWIMNETVITENIDWVLSGESLDPIQNILSGVNTMQQQLTEGLSGLNAKLNETKSLIEGWAKPKSTVVITPKLDVVKSTGDAIVISTWTN